MSKNPIAEAIRNVLNEQERVAAAKKQIEPYVRLYGDANPDESIKRTDVPCFAVATLFIYGEEGSIVNVPINQYKDYGRSKKKAEAADKLTEWLKERRTRNSLAIVGFMNALDQEAAARLGLELIEELPHTRVEEHHGKYRLYFGEDEEPLSFAQAVALGYYMFTVTFAVQQTSFHIPDKDKPHMIALLDRFPGASPGEFVSGEKAPTSQGMKFVRYLKANGATFVGIDATNAEEGIAYRPDTLEGWRYTEDEEFRDPKKHPNFVIVDWLAEAVRAHKHPDEFISEYKKSKRGKKNKNAEAAQEALSRLYKEFKEGYRIFEIANEDTLAHIKGGEKQWEVPDDARDYIYELATGKRPSGGD